jgi:hypothetical protein
MQDWSQHQKDAEKAREQSRAGTEEIPPAYDESMRSSDAKPESAETKSGDVESKKSAFKSLFRKGSR